jgi:hypothetical protein
MTLFHSRVDLLQKFEWSSSAPKSRFISYNFFERKGKMFAAPIYIR